MTHKFDSLMVDIETLGTEPGCIVLSAAFVAFDEGGEGHGPSYVRYLTIDDQVRAGLGLTEGTFLWWLDQSDEARRTQTDSPRIPASAMLAGLQGFVDQYMAPKYTVFAKPPSFDLKILQNLYMKMGYSDLPWSFRQEEDLRGLLKRSGVKAAPVAGVAHDALYDCIAQIESTQAAVRSLRAMRDAAGVTWARAQGG